MVLPIVLIIFGCNYNIIQSPTSDVPKHIQEYLYRAAIERAHESYRSSVLDTYWFGNKLVELDQGVQHVKLTFTTINNCSFSKISENQYKITLIYWVNDIENIDTLSIPYKPEYQSHPIWEDGI